MCGDPTAPALRITSFFAFTFTISLFLFLKHMPSAVLSSKFKLQTSAFVKIVKFFLLRIGSR